jgi:hypothetical protein
VGRLAAIDARPSTDTRFRRLLLAPRDSKSEAVGTVSTQVGAKDGDDPGELAAAASFELNTDQSTGSDYVVRVVGLDVCYLPDAIAPILRVFELPPKSVAESPSVGTPAVAKSGKDKHVHDSTANRAEDSGDINNSDAVVAVGAAGLMPVTYHVFLLGVTLTVVEAAGAAGPAAARRASAATSLLLKHTQAPNGTSCGQVHLQDAQLTLFGVGGDGVNEARRLFGQPVSLSLDYDLLGGGKTRAALQGGELEVSAFSVTLRHLPSISLVLSAFISI